MTFHVSNYGMFGGGLPTDTEGYVYTTSAEWRAATGCSRDEARELARQAREAIAEADRELAGWRSA